MNMHHFLKCAETLMYRKTPDYNQVFELKIFTIHVHNRQIAIQLQVSVTIYTISLYLSGTGSQNKNGNDV